VIPKGWKLGKIRDIASVITGTTPSTNDPDNYGDEYFFVSPADLGSDKYVTITEKMISSKGFLHSRSVRKGSTLFTCIGSTIGKVGIAGQELATNQQINAVVCDRDKADDEYVYYALDFLAPQIRLLAGTQAVPIINKSTFENQKLLLPPLPEQRAIAEILGTWDRAIALVERRIKAVQQRKKGLMQRLLTGRVRFEEFKGKSWSEVKLGEFLTLRLRKTPKPSTCYSALGVRSHGKGTFTREVDDPDKVAMTHLYVVRAGDLIVNITFAWEGAIALAKESDEGRLVSHRFPTYVFDRKKVDPDFFKHVMVTKRFFHELGLISPGGAGRNRVMNKRSLLKMEVNLPSLEEQQTCAEVLCCADREIDLLTRKRDALQRQKKGLMQQLLTGRVRVRV